MPNKPKEENKKESARGMLPEIGGTGTTNFQGNIDTGEYVSVLKGAQLYTTVDKMRWSDATVKAALLMCELPLRSAEWDIEPASEDAQDQEVAAFVEDCLFNRMQTCWDDTLRQILLMHPYGCMAFEVVYGMLDKGKIGWKKWAPRLPKTIQLWNTDDSGELRSITQQAYVKRGGLKTFATIEIPVEKLLVFTFQKEGDNYFGTSILRQAYKHWFFRDKYYKIDAVAQERLGIGIPVITLPDGFSAKDKTDAETMGENLRGHEKAYLVKKTGWVVEMLDMKNGGLRDPMPMLEHHTREILKSVLAQFLDLGSSSKGSFALSADQSRIFMNALEASAKIVEDVVNKEIERLVDYNFNVKQYPKLTHGDIGSPDATILSTAISQLIGAKIITPDDEIESYMRKIMKLPELPEGVETVREAATRKEEEWNRQMANRSMTPDNQDQKTPGKPEEKKKDELPEKKPEQKVKASEFFREFTMAEKRVKFDEIAEFMDDRELSIITKLRTLLMQERPDLIARFTAAIEADDFSELQRIGWKLTSKYSAIFKDEMKGLFDWGKLKSSYEIKSPSPATPREVGELLKANALELTNFHEKTLMEAMKGAAAVAMMDKSVTTEEAVARLAGVFDSFAEKNLPASASLVVAENLNDGRRFTFGTYQDKLYGYQWSAILDGGVCNYCMSMDGRVIGIHDKAFSEYRPGQVHFNCRCLWVAIMKDEVDPPAYTGIPGIMANQANVPPWHFKDLDIPLPGSGKRAMPYGVGVFTEGDSHAR